VHPGGEALGAGDVRAGTYALLLSGGYRKRCQGKVGVAVVIAGIDRAAGLQK